MGLPEHLTCLLRNLHAGQEATVRKGHGTTDRLQIGKGVRQGCILSPYLFNLYAEYIMRNAKWNEAQDRIEIAGRNINNLRYADDTTLVCCSPWGCEESDVTERLNWIGLHWCLKSTCQWHLLLVVQSLSHVWLFCYPMDCNPPGSSVHGISQARILEWVAISFSRVSSQSRIKPAAPAFQLDFFTAESLEKYFH